MDAGLMAGDRHLAGWTTVKRLGRRKKRTNVLETNNGTKELLQNLFSQAWQTRTYDLWSNNTHFLQRKDQRVVDDRWDNHTRWQRRLRCGLPDWLMRVRKYGKAPCVSWHVFHRYYGYWVTNALTARTMSSANLRLVMIQSEDGTVIDHHSQMC